jgi:hypothetical protein
MTSETTIDFVGIPNSGEITFYFNKYLGVGVEFEVCA